MGFLNNLFGGSKLNNTPVDNWNSAWNKLFDEAQAIENDFNVFMQTNGITEDVYIFDVELVNKGRSFVEAEKRRLDSIKGKIWEYVTLGGHTKNISNVDNIDEYLAKVKYLKDKDILFMQDDFINSSMEQIKSCVEYVEQQSTVKDIPSNEANLNLLSGAEFEVVCKQLVEKMGFVAEITKATGGGGIDIVAYNYQPLLSGKYIIQCKRYSGSVGEPIIRDLYGVVTSERANKGILMTTGTFTSPAVRFAEGKPLELIDGSNLNSLLKQYNIIEFVAEPATEPAALTMDEIYNALDIQVNVFDLDSFLLENRFDLDSFLLDHLEYDLESTLYIDYEQFDFWNRKLQGNPKDLTAYWKMIEIIYTHLSMWNTRSGTIHRVLSTDEVSFLSDLLYVLVKPFINSDIRTNDKMFRCICFYSRLVLANCQLWCGNFYGAITNWDFALNNWEYDDPLKKDMVIFSVLTCLNILGLPELAESYYVTYQEDIDYNYNTRKHTLEIYGGMKEVNRSKYDCYCFWLEKKDIHAINTTAIIAFSDLIGEDCDPECDFGIISCLISEVPNLIIRDGTSIILQKWKEPIENGTIIGDIESFQSDKRNILDYFS